MLAHTKSPCAGFRDVPPIASEHTIVLQENFHGHDTCCSKSASKDPSQKS